MHRIASTKYYRLGLVTAKTDVKTALSASHQNLTLICSIAILVYCCWALPNQQRLRHCTHTRTLVYTRLKFALQALPPELPLEA